MKRRPIKMHNNLALAKYSLNTSEQKLFVYAVRNLNQDNEDFVESKFKLTDFANYAGLEITRLYKDINSMIKSLMKTIIEIKDENSDKWIGLNLTRRCKYEDGIIYFVFNDDMKKLLLMLKEHYFLQFPCIMDFTSKYSIRMYDLLKATTYSKNTVEIDLDELREMLCITGKYKRISSLKERVIDVAIEEINSYSDMTVKYDNVYHGRRVGALIFFVQREAKPRSTFGNFYNLNEYREKIGLSDSYSDSHIEILYEAAIEKYTTYGDMEDIFLYMKICYDYTKKRKPTDEFNYYRDVLEKDYPNAIAQINTGYFLEELK